jgi:uncharacterized protein YjdB
MLLASLLQEAKSQRLAATYIAAESRFLARKPAAGEMRVFRRQQLSVPPSWRRRIGIWSVAALAAACVSVATDVSTALNVGSVSVTPPTTTLSIGTQVPLQALVQDPNGKSIPGALVFWSVQNPNIATVSSGGVVTGVALGSTQVAASVNGKSGVAAITVEKTPVGSVVVTPPHLDATPGSRAQLSATSYDAAQNPLSGRAVTWSTSNSAIATVDANGMMGAVSTGSATITATCEGKNGAMTVTVSQAAVVSVTVTPSPLAMSVGQTTQYVATVEDAAGNVLNGRTVTWASSNTSTATVSAAGMVTAVAQGVSTITATSEGKSGTAALTVTNVAVGSVSVLPQGPTIPKGGTVQMTAVVRDVNGNVVTDRTVVWSSSNSGVAAIASNGVVTGVAPGVVTITATSEGKSGASSVTVSAPVAIVLVQPSKDSISLGATAQLTAITEDSAGAVLTGRAVSWVSSNPAVATVSPAGLVTAIALGAATITATSEGKSGTSAITVVVPVASVAVAPPSATILVTQTKQFTATPKDAQNNALNGRAVAWTSSNPGVATVNSSGLATGVAPGTVTITATSEGKSGTATLTVNPVPVASVSITPASPDTVFIGYTTQLTAVTKDSAGGVLTGRAVTWQSANPAVATVSGTGLVSGLTQGNTSITASSEGKTASNNLVSTKVPVGNVTVTPSADSITSAGPLSTLTVAATVTDAKGTVVTDRVVSWTSNPGSVATVSPGTGPSTTVTGKNIGAVRVIATSETKADTSNINVISQVSSVTIAPTSANPSLATSPTVQLTATARNGANVVTGRTITWTSSDSTIATVSTTGLVTAKKVGVASITARVVLDGVNSAPTTITVKP